MVTENHYRWDFIGLSTDNKPTPSDSQKVVNGSTFYCSDNSKLYIWYKNQWYERKPLGGGGGGGGGSYTAGEGIDITDDTISVDTTVIQEKLTAGDNITISDNTISATDTTYTAGSNISISDGVISATDTTYTAGSNISISDGVISATDTTYTAGSNISISDGVISATDTTYSNFVGTDGTAVGTAGLVPAPATTDAGKFLKADGTWDTAGGSSVTVVQTTGNSTTSVMSQKAVTDIVQAQKLHLGGSANASGSSSTALGYYAYATSNDSVAVGANSYVSASATGGIALGANAMSQVQGELNIGTTNTAYGFSSSNYRLIRGVYDGQELHDAATLAQGNTLSTSAPTTATVGVLGQLYTDTTNMHTYQCTAIAGDTYTWTQRW